MNDEEAPFKRDEKNRGERKWKLKVEDERLKALVAYHYKDTKTKATTIKRATDKFYRGKRTGSAREAHGPNG